VFATTGNFFFAEHQARNMEDFGQAMIEFDGGLTATLSAGRAGWRSHPDAGLNRICLVGCKGVAVVDAHRPRVERWVDTAAWAPPPRDPEDPMGMWVAPPESPFRAAPKQAWALPYAASWNLDTRVFLDCIEQGRPSDMHVGLAAAATEVLLAAYESAATGRAVFLPLPREGAG
jgi:predicted dehydrogenase